MNILELIKRETGKTVSIDAHIDALDIDSLEFVALIQAIEKEYDCSIPDSEFARINTVRDLVERI